MMTMTTTTAMMMKITAVAALVLILTPADRALMYRQASLLEIRN